DRLDVQQAVRHREGKEVAVLHARLALAQQVEARLDRGLGVEVVLRLAGAGERRVPGQLEQSQGAMLLAHDTGLTARIRVRREEARQVVAGLPLAGSRDEGRGERERRLLLTRHLQGEE